MNKYQQQIDAIARRKASVIKEADEHLGRNIKKTEIIGKKRDSLYIRIQKLVDRIQAWADGIYTKIQNKIAKERKELDNEISELRDFIANNK